MSDMHPIEKFDIRCLSAANTPDGDVWYCTLPLDHEGVHSYARCPFKVIAELEAALEYYAPGVQDPVTAAKARETLGGEP